MGSDACQFDLTCVRIEGDGLPDGRPIPHAERGAANPAGGSADIVLFVDVLHHTLDPRVLLTEARRVARHAVIIKDHCRDGVLARQTLQLMDWVGNGPHGVALPFNYWTEAQWRAAIAELDLEILHWQKELGLYHPSLRWLFERSLHFVGVFGTARGIP